MNPVASTGPWLDNQPTKATYLRLVIVVIICRKTIVLHLVMHRMYELSRRATNVHALIEGYGTPVPAFTGKFYRVAGGHFLDFFRPCPHARPYAVAVFGAHWNRNNSDGFIKSTPLHWCHLGRIRTARLAPLWGNR